MGKTIIGTRIYSDPSGACPNHERLLRWVRQSLHHADQLIIATDAANFETICNLETVRFAGSRLTVLQCDASQNFVRPLNHILDLSLRQNAKILIYQSVEIDVLESQIQRLKLHLDDQTLVVGAKIIDQHGSSRGRIPLSGWDSPWNTLALWNPEKLGLIGFPAISGGLRQDIPPGSEEVAAISLLQALCSGSCQAKLVDVGPVNWDVNFDSEWRQKYHKEKLSSKSQRASAQLEALGISPGFVSVL